MWLSASFCLVRGRIGGCPNELLAHERGEMRISPQPSLEEQPDQHDDRDYEAREHGGAQEHSAPAGARMLCHGSLPSVLHRACWNYTGGISPPQEPVLQPLL